MNGTVFGWHFVGHFLRDGTPVPADGEWLEHDGELVMCESGLHGSERIIDALRYAPGNTICCCWCEFGGEIERGDDKLVAQRRKILWRVDGGEIMREFARWCALQVIDLWDAPGVVREYLETGDDSLRDAAWDAARVAARDAAWTAAGNAARAAAWAARAARVVPRDAAWDVAWDVAWDAAWTAARAAAGAAAWAPAWNAAWAAARDAQNERLERMVREAHAMEEQNV